VSGCKSGTRNNSEQPCSGPIHSARLAGPVIAMLGRTLGLSGAFPTLVGGHQGSLGATFLGS